MSKSTPDQALEILAGLPAGEKVVLGVERNLCLASTVELYLDSLRPLWLAAALLYLLDKAAPLLQKIATGIGKQLDHDRLRVAVGSLAMPWSVPLWSMRAGPAAAARFANKPLLAALHSRNDLDCSVVSAQPAFIVKPILNAIGLQDAARLDSAALEMPDSNAFPEPALLITGEELTHTGDQVLVVDWRHPEYISAHSRTYVPFWYTTEIKRPGTRYVWRGIIQEDYAFWVLAVSWGAVSTAVGITAIAGVAAGLALLLVSFWCVYEIGYRENDTLGAAHETDPKLSRNIHLADQRKTGLSPWIWSLTAGLLGMVLICAARGDVNAATLLRDFGLWVLLLGFTRALFRLFNSWEKPRRIWLFPWLQTTRNFAFAVAVPITALGAALLAANSIARSIPYLLYRVQQKRAWPEFPARATRLALVVLFGAICWLIFGAEAGGALQATAILLWCLYRARGDTRQGKSQ